MLEAIEALIRTLWNKKRPWCVMGGRPPKKLFSSMGSMRQNHRSGRDGEWIPSPMKLLAHISGSSMRAFLQTQRALFSRKAVDRLSCHQSPSGFLAQKKDNQGRWSLKLDAVEAPWIVVLGRVFYSQEVTWNMRTAGAGGALGTGENRAWIQNV